MEVKKYAHACFAVEKNGSTLIVDPGVWTDDLIVTDTVIGVVITHAHPDHCDIKLIERIVAVNPAVQIFAHADVIAQLSTLPGQPVVAGETVHVGDFALKFVGGEHALIDDSMPPLANLGVIIDESLYYPGDSFALPDQPIETLALPVAAPWMKFSEAATFLRTVNPSQVFPTHDAILSVAGKQLADKMFSAVCQEIDATYARR